jgi:uncharacterized protein (DUF305 family)
VAESEDWERQTDDLSRRIWEIVRTFLLIAQGILILAKIFDWGEAGAPETVNEVDAGFARDMLFFHEQAIAMSDAIIERSTDSELRAFAADNIEHSERVIARINEWIASQGAEFPIAGERLAWVTNMPPYRFDLVPTADEVADLQHTSIVPLEVRYLQLMLKQHQVSQPAAMFAFEHGDSEFVHSISGEISAVQAGEFKLMSEMILSRPWN